MEKDFFYTFFLPSRSKIVTGTSRARSIPLLSSLGTEGSKYILWKTVIITVLSTLKARELNLSMNIFRIPFTK